MSAKSVVVLEKFISLSCPNPRLGSLIFQPTLPRSFAYFELPKAFEVNRNITYPTKSNLNATPPNLLSIFAVIIN